jgi:hypothetical protein
MAAFPIVHGMVVGAGASVSHRIARLGALRPERMVSPHVRIDDQEVE